MTNSVGREVSIRDIAEDHVVEDCGFIPTIEKWLSGIPMEPWMLGRGQRDHVEKTKIPLKIED